MEIKQKHCEKPKKKSKKNKKSSTTLEEVFRTINRTAIFSREESVSRTLTHELSISAQGSTPISPKKIGNYKPVKLGDHSSFVGKKYD